MKKMIKIRNSIIIVLCITILLLCMGFVIVAVELKQKTDEIHSFDVSFDSIKKSSSIKGSTVEPVSTAEVLDGGKIINMDFVLNAPQDEITYTAVITNKGTLPAKIIAITESPDYTLSQFNNMISPVSIKLSDVVGKTIEANDEIELKIVVYYPPSTVATSTKKFNYKIGLIANSK